MNNYKHGQIVWRDLTVKDADQIKDFYETVIGWETSHHDMGDYYDFNVIVKETQDIISGIIHKRSSNDDLPSVWLNYIYVDDVDTVAKLCAENGGKVLVKRKMGPSDFAVLQDPSGAIIAVIH